MNVSVSQRDGPGRICQLSFKNKSIQTPNIIFINTKRYKIPTFADLIFSNYNYQGKKISIKIEPSYFSLNLRSKKIKLNIDDYIFFPKDLPRKFNNTTINFNEGNSYCQIIPPNIDIIQSKFNNKSSIFIIANAIQLYHENKKLIDFITKLREKIGFQKLIHLPAVANPTNLSLLSYMGIDLFDSISAIIAARENILFFPTGEKNIDEIRSIPCNCPYCKSAKNKPTHMDFYNIMFHNYLSLHTEKINITNAIYKGNLRELVNIRVRSDPKLTALLRIFEKNKYDFIETRTPIVKNSQLLSSTIDSLFRPEIIRFQDRILNQYYKPQSTKILLLLPCSAKKPYSFSKSHKLFINTIFNLNNPHIIHELIITSPLGLVPRELELTYPASKYDIPVTNFWYEDEKELIRNLLIQYKNKNKYDKIISHLPYDINNFIDDLIDIKILTKFEKPTSNTSLKKLIVVLTKTTNSYKKLNQAKRKKENIESLASYQFGKKIAKNLLKDCTIHGKYPYQKILNNNNQLGMITKERGIISLTIKGAEILFKMKKYWVEISDDFELKNTILAPGITNADDKIRIGDEVIILRNDQLVAVGVSQMNGDELIESTYGKAIKVRHKKNNQKQTNSYLKTI